MAEKSTAYGDEVDSSELPSIPQYDDMSDEQRAILHTSVGLLGFTAAAAAAAADSPTEAAVRAPDDRVTDIAALQARETLQAPGNIRQLATSSLNSNVGAQLLSLTRQFISDREEEAQVRRLADDFRLTDDNVTYLAFHRRAEHLFHGGYNLRSLVRVQYFVGCLMRRILRDGEEPGGIGSEGRTARLCGTIARYFLRYLTADLLQFLVKLWRDFVAQTRDHWVHIGLFLSGGLTGSFVVLAVLAAYHRNR